ncbi:DUF951 domain-containing protein [Eubacteriaceae bacterium ES3]|nr:DUF951 domain-containing protein [Eubacteriaceae bacterium ES3]
MDEKKYELGDIVELKKKHPCGSYKWQVVRTGADIKIRCLGCDHLVMIPRIKFNKQIKKVIREEKEA